MNHRALFIGGPLDGKLTAVEVRGEYPQQMRPAQVIRATTPVANQLIPSYENTPVTDTAPLHTYMLCGHLADSHGAVLVWFYRHDSLHNAAEEFDPMLHIVNEYIARRRAER